jgi:uncharacterized protein (DUF342 family)
MANQNNSTGTSLPVDAAVRVYVTKDLLEAKIEMEPPQSGGAPVTPKMIDDALSAAKVTYGIDKELIEKIKISPVYSQEIVVARGVAPVNGTDGHIKYNFNMLIDPHPKVRENGTVDYHDLGIIQNATKGTVLSDITLPTKGTEGMGVTGRTLAQKQGIGVSSPTGRNTKLSDDGTQVIAMADGNVTLVNSQVNVNETFVVGEDVDNSTGDIIFVGNVQIFGNVLESFKVDAKGNVDIYGAVAGGMIKAGGNINAHGGIVGKNQSIIECKGNLVSTFLENCTVSTSGSITAESIMNCSIKCSQTLELVGIRAKLVGGRCIVCEDIIANTIGSPANLPTELVLGADPMILTRHAVLLKEIEQMDSQNNKLNQVVALLSQYADAGRLPQDKIEMLESSKLSLNVNSTKLKIKQKELEIVKQKIENAGMGKVVCKGTIYHGVKLSIGFATMSIEEPLSFSSFTNIEGKIVVGTAS